MSRHLFTSDLHAEHPKVAALRGFRSPEEHDAHVFGSLAEAVTEADVLWICGDLAGNARGWPAALRLLSLVPCRKRLVLGNHDPAHPMNRHAWRHTAALAEVFEWWGTAAQTRIGGRDVVLSHFPYTRDRDAIRYPQWRLRNEGAWLLHGHTHGDEIVTVESDGVLRTWDHTIVRRVNLRKEVHVGWDAWRRPVADHEIAEIIATEEEALK